MLIILFLILFSGFFRSICDSESIISQKFIQVQVFIRQHLKIWLLCSSGVIFWFSISNFFLCGACPGKLETKP
jgi:hypothetical protein